MTQAVRPLWIECNVAYVKGCVEACAALSPTNSPAATKLSRYYCIMLVGWSLSMRIVRRQ